MSECLFCAADGRWAALSSREQLAVINAGRPSYSVYGIPHCRTCHEWNHYCCDVCGSCLERVRSAIPGRESQGRDGLTRSDRRFCSSRCRQAAYRARRRSAVGSGAAETP